MRAPAAAGALVSGGCAVHNLARGQSVTSFERGETGSTTSGWPPSRLEVRVLRVVSRDLVGEANSVRARLVELLERFLRERPAEPHVGSAEERRPVPVRGAPLRPADAVVERAEPVGVAASLEPASRLEVRLTPLLTREVQVERRLDLALGPALFECRDTLVTALVPESLDLRDVFPKKGSAGDTAANILALDPDLLGGPEPLSDLTLRIFEAHHVGEPEVRDCERLERRHSHHTVTHGPLLLPRSCRAC